LTCVDLFTLETILVYPVSRGKQILAPKNAGPSNLAKPSERAKHSTVAGYSRTPLPQKLGIKPGMIVVAIDPPEDYRKLLDPIPSGVNFATRPVGNTKFVHLFATRRSQLTNQLSILRRKIADDATLWVSWPKKSSGVATDITEDVIRAVALPLGFVDVKVCAVDEIWSGLKLMIRRENRKSK
jgi:hypothetical protein